MSNSKFSFPLVNTSWTKQAIEAWLQARKRQQTPLENDMSKFGWDYPPGCHSLPWDNEAEDEGCAIARWVDRWFGSSNSTTLGAVT